MIHARTAPAPAASPPDPGPPSDLADLLRGWDAPRLMILGTGPLPIDGATGGVLALDATGASVLALRLAAIAPRTASQVADELDRLAQMGIEDLRQAEPQPSLKEPLARRFNDYFDAPAGQLNRQQAALLFVDTPPSARSWRRLQAELGPRLRGVFLLEGDQLKQLEAPATSSEARSLPLGTRVAAGALVLGLLLAVGAILRLIRAAPVGVVGGPVSGVKAVVEGAPAGATHTEWIGQQHLVHTSDGRLLALISVPGGLEVVADNANGGASWRPPQIVHSLHPGSFAVASDPTGALHVAFSDGRGVAYTVLSPAGTGWTASPPLRLDRRTKTPVVDVAWDQQRRIAHVVWAKKTPQGEVPFWAAVGSRGSKPSMGRSRALSPPGKAVTVLVNEAVDPATGRLLVTYRDGRSVTGWSSRTASPAAGGWRWARPQALPTKAFIGAAALALDPGGGAHLVLRDSTDYRLLYFTKPPVGRWSPPEVAVQAHATSQVDFPALALDASSQLVYLFFETDQFETSPEVRVAVRDPGSGWQPSISLEQAPEGDFFPTALRNGNGQAIALWTRGSSAATVDAARVLAP